MTSLPSSKKIIEQMRIEQQASLDKYGKEVFAPAYEEFIWKLLTGELKESIIGEDESAKTLQRDEATKRIREEGS